MKIGLEMYFVAGRFHATRWGQNFASDEYGEWPPSQWRLLRCLYAVAAQSTAEPHQDPILRSLLDRLARTIPSFHLPVTAIRRGPIRQYHPKAKHSPNVLGVQDSTLVEDYFVALSPNEPVWWLWDTIEGLRSEHLTVLSELCRRIRYFGRAESICEVRLANAGEAPAANCRPLDQIEECQAAFLRDGLRPRGARPVLIADPQSFQPEHLLVVVEDMRNVQKHLVPEGAKWTWYEPLPKAPRPKPRPISSPYPDGLQLIQLAAGARVWPRVKFAVSIAESFRSRVLKRYVEGCGKRDWNEMTDEEREACSPISGKHEDGTLIDDHSHAHFLPLPDNQGRLTRLIVWRREPIPRHLVEAISKASEQPLFWGDGRWPLRLVPLPFDTAPPTDIGFGLRARVWKSITPFVPPRFFVRANGKLRDEESIENQVRRLLDENGYPAPLRIEVPCASSVQQADYGTSRESSVWVNVHIPSKAKARSRTPAPCQQDRRRKGSLDEAMTDKRRGFLDIRITFTQEVEGPICLGHSCHFGLGLFVPVLDA